MATHNPAGVRTMKKLLVGFTVLVVHTAAAHAQQVAPQPPPEQQAPQELPPAYAPPPGTWRRLRRQSTARRPPTIRIRRLRRGSTPRQRTGRSLIRPTAMRRTGMRLRRRPTTPTRRRSRSVDVLDRPFTLGGGIGFGGVIFNDQYSTPPQQKTANGFSYTFRLGFGLRPGLLLLWDVEGAVAPSGTSTVSQTANLVALQIFLTQRLFIKGGFGIADAVPGVNLATQWGAAAMGGIGYEIIQGLNWSFDIEATATGARLNNNGIDQTWTNWSLVNFALNFY